MSWSKIHPGGGEGQGVRGGVPKVCWAAPGLHFPPAHARGGAAMQMGVHPRLAQPLLEPWCWSSAHSPDWAGGRALPPREPLRRSTCWDYAGPYSGVSAVREDTLLSPPQEHRPRPQPRSGWGVLPEQLGRDPRAVPQRPLPATVRSLGVDQSSGIPVGPQLPWSLSRFIHPRMYLLPTYVFFYPEPDPIMASFPKASLGKLSIRNHWRLQYPPCRPSTPQSAF